MMANAEGSEDQGGLAISQLDAEDHAELAIRGWEPQLHAVPEFGPIRSLRIAGEEAFNGDPYPLELLASRTCHFFPCIARSSQILSKGSVIEQRRRSARPLVAHQLPLAVGGLNRAVLGFELSQRRRLGAKALSDRLEGGIRHQGE